MGQESASRYVEYLGEQDWAKVEEHPFNEGEISCMLLVEGELKGRALTPEQSRELATHLNRVADRAEETQEQSEEVEDG